MIGKFGMVTLSLLLIAGVVSACSSSSSTATRSSGAVATAGATTAAKAATVTATTAAAGKASDVCAKIQLADAQALTPQPLQPVTDAGVDVCVFHNAGADLTVTVYPHDTDQKLYKTLLQFGDNELSGVGDAAYWNEPIPGQSVPQLSAHKGAVACVIQSNNPPDTTLKTTGTPPYGLTVADADALAYAQLMGKVCNDVFATQ